MSVSAALFVLFLLVPLYIIVKRSASKGKGKKPYPEHRSAGMPTMETVPPSESAPSAAPNSFRQFESQENRAWLNEPVDSRARDRILNAAAEGEDPCHEGLFPEKHETTGQKIPKEKQTNEWVRAVIMSEVLKRPCERRHYPQYPGGWKR